MNVNLVFMSGCLCKCVILDIFINVWEHTCHTQTIVGDRKRVMLLVSVRGLQKCLSGFKSVRDRHR